MSSSENSDPVCLDKKSDLPKMGSLTIVEAGTRSPVETPTKSKNLTPRQWMTIGMLACANLFSTISYSCIFAFFPSEAQKKGLSTTQIGIIFGIFELILLMTFPLFGKYLHFFGPRKVFSFGLFFAGISTIAFRFVNLLPDGQPFFWTSLANRGAIALANAAFVTASTVISIRSFPGRISTVIGIMETTMGLGIGSGSVIGGALYELGGFPLPFFVLGSLLILGTILSFFCIEKFDEATEESKDDKGMFTMLKIPAVWIMVSAIVIAGVSLSFPGPTLSDHLSGFHFSPTLVGVMFFLCHGTYTIFAPIFGMLIDRWECENIIMTFGSIAITASMLLIGPSPLFNLEKNFIIIGVSLGILGIAVGAMFIPTYKYCLNIVKEHGYEDSLKTYGCVTGIIESAFAFGSFIGPTVGSFGVEKIDFQWTTTFNMPNSKKSNLVHPTENSDINKVELPMMTEKSTAPSTEITTDSGKLSPRQWMTVGMLACANLFSTINYSSIFAFFPGEGQKKGLTTTQIGVIFGIFELVVLILYPIFGKYIHLFGPRKFFFFGLFFAGASTIGFRFINLLPGGQIFFWTAIGIRCSIALGNAAFVTSSFVISIRSFPGRISTVIGIMETSMGLGLGSGSVIGGALYEYGGFPLPFLVLGSLLILASILSLFLIEKFDNSTNESEDGKGMIGMLKIPNIWIIVSAIVIAGVSLSFPGPTLADHLASFNLSATAVGLMFMISQGTYTALAPIFGMLIDRWQCSNVIMIFGAVASIVSMLLIGPFPLLNLSKNLVLIGFSLGILGAAVGGMFIPTYKCCLETVKEHGYEDSLKTCGCVTGIIESALAFGSFIGPTLGSFGVERIGFGWTTTIIAFIDLLFIHLFGPRKVFSSGLFFAGITTIAFTFVNLLPNGQVFFWACIIIRCAIALGNAAFMTSSYVISIKCFPGRISMVIGIMETSIGLGLGSGSVIGGALYEYGGFSLPFLVLGSLLILGMVLSFFFIEKFDENTDESDNGKGIFQMLQIPAIWIMVSAIVISGISMSFSGPTLADHLANFNFSATLVGVMFFICQAMYTISAPVFGVLIDRWECENILMAFGSIAMTVSMLLIGPSPLFNLEKNSIIIGVSLGILGIAVGAMFIPTYKYCLNIVKKHGYNDTFKTCGCVTGIIESSFALGAFIGPTLGSFGVEKVGFEWTTTAIAFIDLLFVCILIISLVAKSKTYPKISQIEENSTCSAYM